MAIPILPHDTAAGSQNRAKRLTGRATKMYTGAGHRQPSSRKKARFMHASGIDSTLYPTGRCSVESTLPGPAKPLNPGTALISISA
jgi:hypothetical protein